MANQKLYDKAKRIAVKNCDVHWDDLSDTNSLWDYIEDDMTDGQLKDAVWEAMGDRIAEDDSAQITGITIDDVWNG